MSESNPDHSNTDRSQAPIAWQVIAWLLCLAACVAGMLDLVAEWNPVLATVQLVVLAVAPVAFMLPSRKANAVSTPVTANAAAWFQSLLVGGLSLWMSAGSGAWISDLPPAYHDEFSYLFQAKTILAGRFAFPSHPTHPELFDQMHVLNEGRMASRYYPGTGLWLAPFVAIGHPYMGPWIAGAVATMLIFWVGREIGGRLCGFTAGLCMALSPGIALFGNTLLSHHATLLALSIFLLGVCRWRRTRTGIDAWIAGSGLSLAMLCRPMTAAAVGLPFGLDAIAWLLLARPDHKESATASAQQVRRLPSLLGFGLPLIAGWCVMLAYNHSVTGDWLTSPYQLYTDVYTPRHVYGFNNVVRGEARTGPKVIEAYDKWAENLTPPAAVRNAMTRWIASWLWTFDVIPLLASLMVLAGSLAWLDRRWWLVVAAIVCLHAVHVPYWYVGIMGWHYVFESAPLWCLVLGAATTLLFGSWRRQGRVGLRAWWVCLLAVSVCGNIVDAPGVWPSRLKRGLGALEYPRQRHASLRQWMFDRVDQRPALVLVEQLETEVSHLDLVVNDPGLNGEILLGRYKPGKTDVAQICGDFPDRQVYVSCPERKTIERIQSFK